MRTDDGESPQQDTYGSSKAEHAHTLILKNGETFAVFNSFGDIPYAPLGEEGAFHEGTRFLSRWELRLGHSQAPLLLSSAVRENNTVLSVDLTNPTSSTGGLNVVHGTLHIRRELLLWQSALHERTTVTNLGLSDVEVGLSFAWDADFVDIFEVRGLKRQRRGSFLTGHGDGNLLAISYEGLDGLLRRTVIDFDRVPSEVDARRATFQFALAPQQAESLDICIPFQVQNESTPRRRYSEVHDASQRAHVLKPTSDCSIRTSNEQFNRWIDRSRADLQMLVTNTAHGLYPYAGIPWFSTVFGRDGLLTARQMLWLNPALAKGVLGYLAAYQADAVERLTAAEPGKILHETRLGEMATLGETPFRRYYGTVDATPLFVMLAAAYFRRTGDRTFLMHLWPSIEKALLWMDAYGDTDKDGFIEYGNYGGGLVNHCWMDSDDSVYHRSTDLARGPIAICEVQAYAYEAKQSAAALALELGEMERAEALRLQAARLRHNFDRSFWIPELGTYALALDGEKSPCSVRGSNAGHCLFAGIATEERAAALKTLLLSEQFFSGWGIRTKALGEPRYSPISYHNGSVWPHDNSLIARGLARYGYTESAGKILRSLFEASTYLPLYRIPELFCGFPRAPEIGPTLYPVACSPQAWATGSVFLLLEACLGLEITAAEPKIEFVDPYLPDFLDRLEVRNLSVGDTLVDLDIQRHTDSSVSVTAKPLRGAVDIIIRKTKASASDVNGALSK
ncbi:MAG: amylo-alpha-1,6-glucosidase [Bdellovibrionales bacterium]|nr:amylo-alpha-1,6-glucosidase [Bdellovibrionales bacterium]